MNETLIKDVTELLKVERLAILSADFERMERIADEKEAVIERLKNTSGFGVDALDRLKKLQIENNALLNASREGIVQVKPPSGGLCVRTRVSSRLIRQVVRKVLLSRIQQNLN